MEWWKWLSLPTFLWGAAEDVKEAEKFRKEHPIQAFFMSGIGLIALVIIFIVVIYAIIKFAGWGAKQAPVVIQALKPI